MYFLSWNCKGMGNKKWTNALTESVKVQRLNVVFLIETKCRTDKMEKLKRDLDFARMCIVEVVGLKGGLVMFWRSGVTVTLNLFRGCILLLNFTNLVFKNNELLGFIEKLIETFATILGIC